MTRVLLAALLATLFTGTALADTCKATATEKKLAGAALNSFMKKCQSDAKKACEADSKAKKLAGAAKKQAHDEMRQ